MGQSRANKKIYEWVARQKTDLQTGRLTDRSSGSDLELLLITVRKIQLANCLKLYRITTMACNT